MICNVKDLLDGIFDTKIEENDIDKLYRLGHWEEGKARPLLVIIIIIIKERFNVAFSK